MMRMIGLMGLVVAAGPALASTPMVVSWPTWLRAGPSERSAVIDELPGGYRVDVVACTAGWCQVISDQAPGYLPQALLAEEVGRPLRPKPGAACVDGVHQTPERAIPLRICPAE